MLGEPDRCSRGGTAIPRCPFVLYGRSDERPEQRYDLPGTGHEHHAALEILKHLAAEISVTGHNRHSHPQVKSLAIDFACR